MKHIGKITYLIISLVFVLLPVFWIPDGFVYTSEEANFINYDIKLDKASTAWTKDNGMGSINDPSNQSLIFPNAVFYRSLRSVGFDRSMTQRLFISFIFLSISIAFGLFSAFFTKNWFVKSVGLIFYICNFYLVSSLGYTAKTLQLALMPGIFFFFYMYLKTRKVAFIALNYIWLFIFQAVFTNLPLAITSFASYPLSLLFFVYFEKSWKLKTVLLDALIFSLSSLPILAYQLIVYLPVVTDIMENPSRYAFSAVGAPLDLIFQMRGVWWEKSGHMGVYYFNLSYFYDNPLVVILSTLCTIAVISCQAFMSSGIDSDDIIKSSFWLTIYLLGVGLASGFYFLPGFFTWLFETIPGMVMFREPWAKFVPLILVSFAAGLMISLDYLSRYKRPLFYILFAFILASSIAQSYPFVTGKIIDKDAIGWKRRLVKIPEYWEEYGRWSEDRQGVVLAIPFGTTPFNSLHNWYPGQEGNSILPLPNILGKMNVISDSSPIDKYSTVLKKFVADSNFDLIKLGGLDYVLVQDDLEILGDTSIYDWQKESIKQYIYETPFASFGDKVKIYKIKDEYTTPTVFIARGIVNLEKGSELSGVYQLNQYGKENIFSYTSELNLNNSQYLKLDKPEIQFTKESETVYRGTINGAEGPFVIVLNQSFHRLWKIDLSSIHFTANGYANGWFVDTTNICDNPASCDLEFVINFSAQKPFSFAMAANVLFAVLSVFGLVCITARKLFVKFLLHH